jgi:preprotein translocase subunit SecG
MSIVINILMVLLVALCLLMLLIILMQRPKQEGLGAAFGGGMMDGMLGSGTTNFLQKATVYLTVGYRDGISKFLQQPLHQQRSLKLLLR